MTLRVLSGAFSVVRLGASEDVPVGLFSTDGFISVTKTAEEISVVCETGSMRVDGSIREERGWKLLMVEGPLDFSLTGILSSISSPIASAGISLFAISTYDTDYLLVRDHALDGATLALRRAGFTVVRSESGTDAEGAFLGR